MSVAKPYESATYVASVAARYLPAVAEPIKMLTEQDTWSERARKMYGVTVENDIS